MTLGELFIKIGFQPDVTQLNNIKQNVSNAASAIQSKANGIKKAGSTIGSGLAGLGKNIKGFFGGLKSSAESVGAFIADLKAIHYQVIAVGAAIVGITKKASDYAAELLRFNSVTGISTQSLQALQQQAAASGVEASEVASTLKDLQEKAIQAQMGVGSREPWALLGLQPNSDPIAVLGRLKERLKEFSPARGAMLARGLGISDNMIAFIKEAENLGSSNKNLLMSDREIKRLKEFNIYFNKSWDALKRTLMKLGTTLIPITMKIVDGVQRVVHATQQLGSIFAAFGNKFKYVSAFILGFFAFLGVQLFPVTAVFLGLALALDDVMTWVRGGKSLIGDLIGPFKDWKWVIDDVNHALSALNDLLKDLSKPGQFVTDVLRTVGYEFKQLFGIGPKEVAAPIGAGAQAAALTGQGASAPPTQVNNDVTVNVNGAKDPKSVAQEVVNHINSNTMYQQPVRVKK